MLTTYYTANLVCTMEDRKSVAATPSDEMVIRAVQALYGFSLLGS